MFTRSCQQLSIFSDSPEFYFHHPASPRQGMPPSNPFATIDGEERAPLLRLAPRQHDSKLFSTKRQRDPKRCFSVLLLGVSALAPARRIQRARECSLSPGRGDLQTPPSAHCSREAFGSDRGYLMYIPNAICRRCSWTCTRCRICVFEDSCYACYVSLHLAKSFARGNAL